MKIKSADMILKNGRFLTMETPNEMADAVAVENDRIIYVGSEQDAMQFADGNTEIVDLHGKVAAPGLIDCHTHPMSSCTTRFCGPNFRGTTSITALLDGIREAAAKTPKGEWIVARGFDESKLQDFSSPMSAEILDQATTDHPVLLYRTCGHIAILNTMAMEKSGFTDASEDPAIGGGHFFKDSNGHLTGMISGSVTSRVPYKTPTDTERANAMILGVQRDFFKNGITATAEMGSVARNFRLLQKLDNENKLKLRIGFYFTGRRRAGGAEPVAQRLQEVGLLPGFGTDHLSFLGIKFVMDGSTGGKTAAFSIPYVGEPTNYGELYNDQRALNEDVLKSAKAGIQISIHAIGDRAIESALESIEYAHANGVDITKCRVRLEHLESPTPDQIERIQRLNIAVGLSSAFIYSLGDSHLAALGYDRLIDAFPAKTLMDHGITVACNSDCPVCDVNPMYGIYSMVTRTTEKGQSFGGKKEAVDRLCALKSYTKDAAYLLHKEDVLGTLTVGKMADIAVFDQDFLTVPDEELKDVSFYMTISGGEIVYQKSES